MITVSDLGVYAPSVLRLVRRSGWTIEDVKQEAWLCLQAVALRPGFQALPSEADQLRYAGRALAHWCTRKAKGYVYSPLQAEDRIVDDRDESLLIELNDMIDSAPADVKDYLGARVVEQLSWDETKAALGLCNYSLARLRVKAADWLLAQYEGDL